MSFSLSRGKPLDVGHFGIAWDELPPMEAGPIDLGAWFHPDASPDAPQRPLELEIGSGKGTFLVQQAALTPEVDYIGIEYARAFWRYAADRVRRHGMNNVRLVHTEAGAFVRHYVPDRRLRQVHIYFPDPWPKARHNKRRLIQAPFLTDLHRVLQDGGNGGNIGNIGNVDIPDTADTPAIPATPAPPPGQIRIATDHSDYYQWMLEHVAQVTHLYDQLPFESPDSAGEGELVGTNFERKYRREGRPFHGLILRKRIPAAAEQSSEP